MFGKFVTQIQWQSNKFQNITRAKRNRTSSC